MLYRWNENTIGQTPTSFSTREVLRTGAGSIRGVKGTAYTYGNNVFNITNPTSISVGAESGDQYISGYSIWQNNNTAMFYNINMDVERSSHGGQVYGTFTAIGTKFVLGPTAGDFIQYVYSSNPDAYPLNAQSGSYWYSIKYISLYQ